jgi:hypothetical protein
MHGEEGEEEGQEGRELWRAEEEHVPVDLDDVGIAQGARELPLARLDDAAQLGARIPLGALALLAGTFRPRRVPDAAPRTVPQEGVEALGASGGGDALEDLVPDVADV